MFVGAVGSQYVIHFSISCVDIWKQAEVVPIRVVRTRVWNFSAVLVDMLLLVRVLQGFHCCRLDEKWCSVFFPLFLRFFWR